MKDGFSSRVVRSRTGRRQLISGDVEVLGGEKGRQLMDEHFKSLLTAKTEQVPLQQCGLDNSGDALEVTNGDAFFWPVLVMNRDLKGRPAPNAPNWLMLSIPTRVPRGAR